MRKGTEDPLEVTVLCTISCFISARRLAYDRTQHDLHAQIEATSMSDSFWSSFGTAESTSKIKSKAESTSESF